MARSKMNDNRNAFLDMLAFSEGTLGRGDDGYNVLFGGKFFDGYGDHPRVRVYEVKDEFIRNNKKDYTTAAGRYQMLAWVFDAYKKLLNLPDFSPESQDAIAIRIIIERGAIKDVDEGRFADAVRKCKNIWASLPGAGYGQPERKVERLLAVYKERGGKVLDVV